MKEVLTSPSPFIFCDKGFPTRRRCFKGLICKVLRSIYTVPLRRTQVPVSPLMRDQVTFHVPGNSRRYFAYCPQPSPPPVKRGSLRIIPRDHKQVSNAKYLTVYKICTLQHGFVYVGNNAPVVPKKVNAPRILYAHPPDLARITYLRFTATRKTGRTNRTK